MKAGPVANKLRVIAMASSEEKDRTGFSVTDRRAFTPEGQPRAAAEPSAPQTEDTGAPAAAPGRSPAHLPPVDFPTFTLSLASSVLYHLGERESPGQKAETNLPMAKHTIDILSMLQEKTRGNLTAPEAELLENLLCDLRLRYVASAKS